MPNFSATSDPASSLQPPDGHGSMTTDQRNGGISADMKKRLFQLESEKEFLKEDNTSLRASKIELEDKLRDQRRLLEDKDEINSKLERDGKSLAEKLKMSEENCEKWKEKYETLREGSDSGERKWKARLEEIRMKCWQLEVDKKSLEMDLTGDRTGELTEKLKTAQRLMEEKDKACERLLEEKDVTISKMKNKIQNFEREKDFTVSEMMMEIDNLKREKMKIEEELGHRVLNLEESVEERTHCTDSGSGKEKTSGGIRIALGCNVQDKGRVSSKRSGPISTGISTLIEPKQENMEVDEHLTWPAIKKKPYAPKQTDVYTVDISDEEEEEENKQTPSFATPSNAERPSAGKRKSEAATCCAEMQDGAAEEEMKRAKKTFIPFMTRPAPGGPDNPEFFRSWPSHVSHEIFEGKERRSLSFQYRHSVLDAWPIEKNSIYEYAVRQAGMEHLPSITYSSVDEALIEVFIERWNPETNSFHLPIGEMSIALHDVYKTMGIKIEGNGMGLTAQEQNVQPRTLLSNKINEAGRVLGIVPDKGGCSHKILKTQCMLPNNYSENMKGSVYVLYLISSILFPDKSQNLIPLSPWDYVKDLKTIGDWSWGSALLASVYRDLGECTRIECKKISTCYTLILAWIYAYFPCFAPPLNPCWDESMPYASKWLPRANRRRRRDYRKELDDMTVINVEWYPYGELDFTLPTLAPSLYEGVISFGGGVTEPYTPDHFKRQFGCVQDQPKTFITAQKAWRCRAPSSYVVKYSLMSWAWNTSSVRKHTIYDFGPRTQEGHECTDDYLSWYLSRTHPYISRPNVDEYRKVINKVCKWLEPYRAPRDDQYKDMVDALNRSLDVFEPFNRPHYW